MNILFKSTCAIALITVLVGCGSSEGGFTPGGSGAAGVNIPVAAHFSVAPNEAIAAVLTGTLADSSTWVWNVDHEVTLTVTAGNNADAKITSGTVYFAADYGLLSASSCTISKGECSVKWYSEGEDLAPADNHVAITAWMMGEESYIDIDGSGDFNDGDIVLTDTSEPFVDTDHDVSAVVPPAFYIESYNAGADEIIDVDNNGAHTPADGLFNGTSCKHSTLCSTTTRIPIFDILILNLDART